MINQSPTRRLYTTDENDATVVLLTRQHRNYNWRFLTMFIPGFAKLASLDRPSVYYRVLFHALGALDPVQFRSMSARETASETSMSLISAQRGIMMLERDNVLIARGVTSNKQYRLNNQVAWASTSEKHNKAEPDQDILDGR